MEKEKAQSKEPIKKIDSPYYKIVMAIHKELMLQEKPNRYLIKSMVDDALNIYYGNYPTKPKDRR